MARQVYVTVEPDPVGPVLVAHEALWVIDQVIVPVGVIDPTPATVAVKVMLVPLVLPVTPTFGANLLTVRVRVWVAGLPTPLLAWGHSL